ncbi:MAG: transposase, partial [Actinobacteria bacterium]|nr:transposase [Actinomycetota bacterium]
YEPDPFPDTDALLDQIARLLWSDLLRGAAFFNVVDAGIRRIRMRLIPDASSESLLSFVQDMIESGSIVMTSFERPVQDQPLLCHSTDRFQSFPRYCG